MTTDADTTGISLFDFVPGLPVEDLHKELDAANAGGALLKRKMARCLCDMQVRGVYALTGHGSAAHYAIARLGMDRRRAHELVQIGRQLEELPEIDAALLEGEISWSKMRILLRVAAPDTQVEWLAHADETNCERLSIDASRCLRGDLPKRNSRGGLPDIRMDVRASLVLANHQLWENAKRKLSAEGDLPVTNEDLMILAARWILSTDVDGAFEGRTKVKHSPFQLIVHQEKHPQGMVCTRVHTDHGDVELSEDQAERVAAEAEIVPAAAPVKDPGGKTPARVVRRVLARDNHRCQNCGKNLYLQVHHVEFRSLGGKTEEDLLAALCAGCHAMVHSGLLSMHGDATGGFVFLDRSGEAIEGRSASVTAETLRQAMISKPPARVVDGLFSIWHRLGVRRELAPALRIPTLRMSTPESQPRTRSPRGS